MSLVGGIPWPDTYVLASVPASSSSQCSIFLSRIGTETLSNIPQSYSDILIQATSICAMQMEEQQQLLMPQTSGVFSSHVNPIHAGAANLLSAEPDTGPAMHAVEAHAAQHAEHMHIDSLANAALVIGMLPQPASPPHADASHMQPATAIQIGPDAMQVRPTDADWAA